jgi:hypothetical protein
MTGNTAAYLETRRAFLANRAAFPAVELAKHAGQWVAWSPDGARIIASALHPELLDEMVQASGADPALCVVEGIPDDNALIGEADGSAA